MNQQQSRPLAAPQTLTPQPQEPHPREQAPAPRAAAAPAPTTPTPNPNQPLTQEPEFLAAVRQRKQRYLRMDWAWEKGNELCCSSPALRILIHMAVHADFATGAVPLAPQEIRAKHSFSDQSLRRALKELTRLGLLESQGRNPTAWGAAPQYRFPVADRQWDLNDQEEPAASRSQLGFLAVETNVLSPAQIELFQQMLTEAGLTWEQAKPRLKSFAGLDYTGLELAEIPRHRDNRLFEAMKKLKRQAGRRDVGAAALAPQTQPELALQEADPGPPITGEPDPAAQERWSKILAVIETWLPHHSYLVNFGHTQGHAWTAAGLLVSTPHPLDSKELKRDFISLIQQAEKQLQDGRASEFEFQHRANSELSSQLETERNPEPLLAEREWESPG